MADAVAFKDKALEALKTVIDPELGVDIVNLGLIYDVTLNDIGEARVTMTLTIMGCPLTDELASGIAEALGDLPEVKEVVINLVWEPAWTIARMSREARLALGV